MQRRKFISYALASACNYGLARAAPVAVPSDKASGGGGDIPVWAPAAGEIRNISHAPRRHPLGAGAVLSEIDPKYQPWNPEAPRQGPYKATEYYWGSVLGYCGVCHNPDTRQLVIYGAGHASINVCAPFAFDLNDLRWKWLDVPLPFDGYRQILVNRHSAPPSEATVRLYYPEEQLDYDWGELKGDWMGCQRRCPSMLNQRSPSRWMPPPLTSMQSTPRCACATTKSHSPSFSSPVAVRPSQGRE